MKSIIDRIDHLVLTVTDIEVTTQFYEKALGFEREFFTGPEGQPRYALDNIKLIYKIGQQKRPLKQKYPLLAPEIFV